MKLLAKHLANALAFLAVLPSYLLFSAGRLLVGSERAFPGWSQAYSLLPGLSGVYLRRAFYRLIFPHCAADAWLSFGTIFSHPTARIGRTVYVGLHCCIGDVTLEDDVMLGSFVSVVNGGAQHGIDRLDVPIREQPGSFPHITIGRDSWIGERSVVLADVGKHCVVGAGSLVLAPIPDYAIAVGVPARVIRYRTDAPAQAPAGTFFPSANGPRDAVPG